MFERSVDADVSLVLLEEQHAPALFALVDANRAHLRRWLPWLDANTRPEHTAAFIRTSLHQFALRTSLACGIRFQGELVGVCDLHRIDHVNRRTSIGYWLAEPFSGRGIATRACRGLLDYGFGELALNRIAIDCAAGNTRSCAIPERLGFVREGLLRQREWLYDRHLDMVVYSMLASEWRTQTAQA
jgi:ribosomal-protein-serine acetyltransferase